MHLVVQDWAEKNREDEGYQDGLALGILFAKVTRLLAWLDELFLGIFAQRTAI